MASRALIMHTGFDDLRAIIGYSTTADRATGAHREPSVPAASISNYDLQSTVPALEVVA